MIGVVLAGGPGERLSPLSKGKPKAFLRLAGKLLLEYSLDELKNAGVNEIVIVVPPNWSKGMPWALENVYIVEQETEGSLESAFNIALKKVKESKHSEIIFSFVGFLSAPKGMARSVLEFYSSSGYPAVVSAVPVISGLETYGFIKLRGSRVETFKPPFSEDRRFGGYVFGGILVGNIDVLEDLANKNYYEVLSSLASKGLLGATVWHGEWTEIGYPWDILESINIVSKLIPSRIEMGAFISRDVIIEGNVLIEKGAIIKSGAIIEGPAYIGKNSIVGRNSILISSIVNDDAVIMDRAKVEKSVIMDRATVGECSLISNSVVGEDAKIGPYVLVEVGKPENIPERLKSYVKFTRRPPRLGGIIGPKTALRPFSIVKPGEIIE